MVCSRLEGSNPFLSAKLFPPEYDVGIIKICQLAAVVKGVSRSETPIQLNTLEKRQLFKGFREAEHQELSEIALSGSCFEETMRASQAFREAKRRYN